MSTTAKSEPSAPSGLLDVDWSSSLGRALGVALTAAQLGLLIVVAGRFNLESEAFRALLSLALGGFVVHAFLPAALRPAFFVALSLAGTGFVLGLGPEGWDAAAGLGRTASVVGIGGLLVALCHLPVSFRLRVLALLAVAGALALARGGVVRVAALDPVWPVLGAMFMFRLVIYAYDVAHGVVPRSVAESLAYFFLVPAVCFPLFPVIDFKAFHRGAGHHDYATFQRGVHWMFRGAVHLVLWRWIYYHGYLDPKHVAGGADLARYVLGNVALYLRISGQFHMIAGLLHLFGYRLPETNQLYFLASSVTDYWRRVNVYWKDFIMKIFYYPAVFRLKAWGETPRIALATLYAFAATWLLHSYQWFWLRGDFPIRSQDVIFWGALALLVIANSLWEMRRGRRRRLSRKALSARELAGTGLATAATFSVVTGLWSVWTADSPAQWLALWQHADGTTLAWFAAALAAVALGRIAVESLPAPASLLPGLGEPLRVAVACVLVPACGLLLLSSGRVQAALGPETAGILRSLSDTKPNKSDEEFMVRGYYEELMDVGRFNALLNESFAGRPAEWQLLEATPAIAERADLRTKVLVPGVSLEINGERFSTNELGMRDRSYPPAPAPGTRRVAVLGSSLTMGWGVSDGESFEALLEERLNEGGERRRVELLNFAVNGYSPLAQVAVLEEQVLPLSPDALLLVGHKEDPLFTKKQLAKALRMGAPLGDERLVRLAAEAEVDARTPELWAERRLERWWPELVRWAFDELVRKSRAAGVVPVYLYLPGVLQSERDARDEELIALARDAGFEVITLWGWQGEADPAGLQVAPFDAHPNREGHRRIATALAQELRSGDPLGVLPRETHP